MKKMLAIIIFFLASNIQLYVFANQEKTGC
jgi:hypothetical protein